MSESCLSKFLLIRRIGRFSPAVWITMCLIVASSINLAGTRAYGEMEFWFAIIKVLTIIGLIILGIILDAGGGPSELNYIQ